MVMIFMMNLLQKVNLYRNSRAYFPKNVGRNGNILGIIFQ